MTYVKINTSKLIHRVKKLEWRYEYKEEEKKEKGIGMHILVGINMSLFVHKQSI